MIGLFSTILGFLGSIVPEAFKIYKDNKDRQHELDIMDRQLAQQKSGQDSRLAEIETTSRGAMNVAVQESWQTEVSTLPKKYGWVLAYAAIVRPTVTFILLVFYGYYKWCVFQSYAASSLPWNTAAAYIQAGLSLWSPFDEVLLGTVIGFWFGERGFKKNRE